MHAVQTNWPDARIAAMTRSLLCRISDLPDSGARGFTVQSDAGTVHLFVVRLNGILRAYVNRCPHRGTPLDWEPDEFLDPETQEIVCATHGARFRPEDGSCLDGPCRGRGLQPVGIEVEGDRLYLRDLAP